jgi:hypothetical protein
MNTKRMKRRNGETETRRYHPSSLRSRFGGVGFTHSPFRPFALLVLALALVIGTARADETFSRPVTFGSGSSFTINSGITLSFGSNRLTLVGTPISSSDAATKAYVDAAIGGGGIVSDTAFGSSWNGVTTIAPSKNAIYDWAHTFDTDDNGKVNVLDIGAGIVKTDAGGVVSSITDNSSNWDTAYADRMKWDGGAMGLTASAGRASLGATTVGGNLFTVTNPSAIRFLKVNADNSVTFENAATMLADLGGGTVTSVGVTAPAAGIAISGGTITTSGTFVFSLTNDLAALEGLTGTGISKRTGTDAWSLLSDTTVGDNLLTLANPGAISWLRINADNTVTTRSAANTLTDLGATTVGGNIFSVTNPSAIRFLKVNADNSVTLEDAATMLGDLGGGTGGGTVTNVSSSNLSPLFNVSVATPTTTPAFSFAQISQSANLFFASPDGSSGNPTFRALVLADLPAIPESKLSIADNTTANASTSAHGFVKKLPNDATLFYNGVGNYTAPSTVRVVGAVWDTTSTTIVAKAEGFITVPYGGTITGWSISLDSGTCTVKVWKKAAGTAVPTASDSINTSGVSISTGTHIRSSTTSDFTTTTATAGDILAFNLQTYSGSTEVTFELEITSP